MKNKIYPVLLVIFTMVLTSITTSQAIPAQTTYYACVNKSSGAIKMISQSKSCKKTEKKINWNNIGPAGAQGEPGQQGEQGVSGQDATAPFTEILLTSQDFAKYTDDDPAQHASAIVPTGAGWPRPVWIFDGSTTNYSTIQTSIPRPSDWDTATAVRITVIAYAAEVTGDTEIHIGYGGYSSDAGALSTWTNWGTPDWDGTPQNEKIFEFSTQRDLSASVDLLDIAIWRTNDANTGDVYILGAKVEAVVSE